MMKLLLAACTLAFLSASSGYKILLVFPIPAKSHAILGDGYVRLLTEAGHEVHYMTPYPKKNIPPNLHQIDISEVNAFSLSGLTNISASLNKEVDLLDVGNFIDLFIQIAEVVLANDNVNMMLDDQNQKFDIIIVEWLFLEVFAGFAAVFSAPLVWSSSVEPHAIIYDLIGEDLNPAYNCDMRSALTPPFNFVERVSQLFMLHTLKLLRTLKYSRIEKGIYERAFGPYAAKRDRELPPYDELRYNASLVLGNSHVSLGQATTLPQSYKSIGGYHIDTKVKPLPKDLQKLMDDAKHGIIYFSMGSNLNSNELPEKIRKSLLKMFGALKQTVLWKFEEVLPDLPKNVRTLKWAPQQSILSHPNLLLFITHGGLLSITEAIHCGVPVIGIPVFGDQFANIKRAQNKGFAKKVDLSYGMAEDLEVAINEMLSNPLYRMKVKELSFIYHHRPVSPGKELVHWIEHVVETRGAPHLRSPGFFTLWYQKLYLDFLALALVSIYTIGWLLKRVFRGKNVDKFKKNS